MKEMFIEVSMVCHSHFVIFNFLQGKVVCFGARFQVAHLLGPCLLCVKKSYLSVLFAQGRWDCWSVHPWVNLTKKNGKFFIWRQNTLSFNYIQSVNFLSSAQCKMLVSANILLISLVWRHTCIYCIRIFKIKKTLSRSVASCQAIENNDLLRKEKTIG